METQETIEKRPVNDILWIAKKNLFLKIVDHLNPSDLWDMTQKFLWQEGPIEFLTTRFYNTRKALEASTNISLYEISNQNDTLLFRSNESKTNPICSGIIMPSSVQLDYEPFIDIQKKNYTSAEAMLKSCLNSLPQKDDILLLIPTGTTKSDSTGIFSFNQFGAYKKIDDKSEVLSPFYDPYNINATKRTTEDQIDLLHGAIVLYDNGRSKIISTKEINSYLKIPEVNSIVEPNFIIRREEGEDGYQKLLRVVNKVDEWQLPNDINIILRFETPQGIRYGTINYRHVNFSNGVNVIESISDKIGATSWVGMIGEYINGAPVIINNKRSQELLQPNIKDKLTIQRKDINSKRRLYASRDYFVLRYKV